MFATEDQRGAINIKFIHARSISFSGVDWIGSCDGEHNCLNTDLDEASCTENFSGLCDLICRPEGKSSSSSAVGCVDESYCNGFKYGVWCELHESSTDRHKYYAAEYVCDGEENCSEGTDEKDCTINETTTTCIHARNGNIVPLHNYTRCAARIENNVYIYALMRMIDFCVDYVDQTNCSDPDRVGLLCSVNGYMTTIARQILCPIKEYFYGNKLPKIPKLCDDGLDKACVHTSRTCFVHKHLLCDEITDCDDSSDESHEDCRFMTVIQCTRRYRSHARDAIIFPLAWVLDGVSDCTSGEDEGLNWPTCGRGPTLRVVNHKKSVCDEVFLCFNSDQQFIEFSRLCDRENSCEIEKDLCSVSRMQTIITSTVMRDSKMTMKMQHCLKGLTDFEYLSKDNCSSLSFLFPGAGIFGRNKTSKIILPINKKKDCRYFYGEYYVFISCLGRCKDASCPLTRAPMWNSCEHKFGKEKIFTRYTEGKLTFLIKDLRTGELGNDLFLCENNNCVTYDKVCNLADDCGDSSDESSCINHFKCKQAGEYLPITQKCDGTIHCSDFSDECNDSCGQEIVSNTHLKIVAWVIGILALILNSVSITKSISSIKATKTEPALLNKALVIMIGVGDLSIGIYLTMIAAYDTYYNRNYCFIQLQWVSSNTCMALGILSTTGSQVSLLSMTALSLLRVLGLGNSLRIPGAITKKSGYKLVAIVVFILVIASTISWLPLYETLEDFFVNGIRYDDSNSLFQGCPNKNVHRDILQMYYGRITAKDISWAQIKILVDAMFSNDYGGISRYRLSFYGNDPVCLFKYYVKTDDPQKFFVFVIICMNFTCFVVIAVSYGVIVFKTKKSAKKLCDISSANTGMSKLTKKTNKRLQTVTQWIIFTDFVCWVPFIITCCLHFGDVLDATPWYPVFSILVLPINSVINPLLYNDIPFSTLLQPIFKGLKERTTNCLQAALKNVDSENIELQVMGNLSSLAAEEDQQHGYNQGEPKEKQRCDTELEGKKAEKQDTEPGQGLPEAVSPSCTTIDQRTRYSRGRQSLEQQQLNTQNNHMSKQRRQEMHKQKQRKKKEKGQGAAKAAGARVLEDESKMIEDRVWLPASLYNGL